MKNCDTSSKEIIRKIEIKYIARWKEQYDND